MKNRSEAGYSWPESVLALGIISLIFSTLLPLSTNLLLSLEQKRIHMYAAQTAYNASIAYRTSGQRGGTYQIEEIEFYWTIGNNEICVSSPALPKGEQLCVSE